MHNHLENAVQVFASLPQWFTHNTTFLIHHCVTEKTNIVSYGSCQLVHTLTCDTMYMILSFHDD